MDNAEDVRGKVKAVCAAVQLQAHGLGRDIFGRARSVTVDRGVEYKLCSILGTLEHYIPNWHSRRELNGMTKRSRAALEMRQRSIPVLGHCPKRGF